MLRLAIDTGGTFTDFVLRDEASGASWFAKTLSTPSDPARATLDGIDRLASVRPFHLGEVGEIRIATTVATNAILERKGGRTALVTTRGFRDVLIMGRSKRFDTYDLWLDKPRPLVPRRAIHEVDERIDHDGEVLRPLDLDSVSRVAERLAADGVESVAVCLLHAYANPAHEREVGTILAERLAGPSLNRGVSLSLSSDVSATPARIRADQHRRRQRLCETDRRPVPRGAGGRLRFPRLHRRASRHAVQRGPYHPRPRPGVPGQHHRVGTGPPGCSPVGRRARARAWST